MIPIKGHERYVVSEEGVVTNTKTGKALSWHLNENGYMYVSLHREGKSNTRTVHRLVAEAYIPNPENKPFVNHKDANRANPHKDNLEWCTQSENICHAYRLGNMSQKQNFSQEELDWLLDEFLKNKSMTELAKSLGVGLSRLTINLRNRAHKTGRVPEFEAMLIEQKRQRNTEANAEKRKPVIQLDTSGNVLAEYPSATAATRALGKSSSGPIHNALNPNNPQKIGYGFQWKYA